MTPKNWATLIVVIGVLMMVGGVLVGPNALLGVVMILAGFVTAWNALIYLYSLSLDRED